MRTVFLSHSSKDIDLVTKISNHLEQLGQRCWYSERDLDKTKPYWQDDLIHAVNGCYATVVILTQSALSSGEVLNEISNVSAQNKLVVVYFAENVPLTQQFEYYLRKYEWLTAYSMTFEESLDLLCQKLSVATRSKETASVEIAVNDLLRHEDPCFDGIHNGSYGVGFDKCLISNGTHGWHPSQVFLEYADREEFTFASIGYPELDAEYEAFCSTPEFRRILSRGNNRTRWMLSEIYQNDKLFLSLRKTIWSRTTFWWNQVRNNPEMRQKMALQTFHSQDVFFPNSFCLHLIMETADDLLVCTRVSMNKKNDYASTIAVTIGEQIEEYDFSSGDANNNQFVYEWVRRALFEEFNFSTTDYPQYVDEHSIRVLGINYEGDIYNFSLPVYVRLKLSFDNLLAYMAGCPSNNPEFTELIPMTKEEILHTLYRAGESEVSRQYHPSSFLRMLQYLNFKYPDILHS